MKKGIISFLTGFFCVGIITAQEKTAIEPSGNIITKDVSVKPFDAIRAEGLYELVISQGASESVKIEADDNLQSMFEVKNEGSTLVIDMPDLKDNNINFKNKDDHQSLKLKVYVSCKNLKRLDVAVIGNVHSETA